MPDRLHRLLLQFLLLFGLATAISAASQRPTVLPPNSDDVKRQNFSFDTRLRYNSALVNGVKSLNVLVAAKMGHTEEAIRGFESCGGRVEYRFDPVGYFWGSIRTDDFPKLLAIQDIIDIELDGPTNSGVDYIMPSPEKGLNPSSVWLRQRAPKPPDDSVAKLPPLPAEKLEGSNLYLPWYLMGVTDFRKAHPTFDGRGTTIAVVEGYGDLLHPVLQEARTLGGTVTPKTAGIVDVSSDTDPFYDRGRGYYPSALRLKMVDEITATTNSVEFRGIASILPTPGRYKLAELSNGGRHFWVIYSPERGSVWVDTNQNHNFADEVELKDINTQFSAAQIPAERGLPTQQMASATSFSIAIDKDRSEIKFFLNLDDHGTGVASIAAGKGFFGGNGDGVAPGARILFVTRGNGSLHDDVKAFIIAASRSDVDVVTCSFAIKPMIAGETVTSLILDRLALVYQKPMFFTVTAGPTATTDNISDQGTGPHVFGIMGYTTAEIWHQFYGVNVPLRDNDPDGGGQGPAINGAIKPDFVTPFHQLAAGSCTPNVYESEQRSTVLGYRLPPCYVKFGGTSGSTPEAAGLAALIISGAKQEGKAYDLARLAWALRSSAAYLDQSFEPVGYQGYGLPDVAAAWRLFSSAEITPEFRIASKSEGPHETERRAPNQGMGIYEYSRWHPRMKGTRVVAVARLSGASDTKRYRLVWRGNDGTFVAPSEIDLPLAKPQEVKVTIAPKTSGIHQAILQIVDPKNGTTLFSFLNTIVAAEPLVGSNQSASWETTIPLSHEACSFFDVKPGTVALAVNVNVKGGPALMRTGPSSSQGAQDFVSYYLPHPTLRYVSFKEPGDKQIAFDHPAAGEWAFCIRNHQGAGDPQGQNRAHIQVAVKVSGLSVTRQTENVRPRKLPPDISMPPGTAELTNRSEALSEVRVRSHLGREEFHSVALPQVGISKELDFEVPGDARQFLLSFVPGDNGESFGAAVYACAPSPKDGKQQCQLEDYREHPDLLDYEEPKAGTWKLLLYRIGAGGVAGGPPVVVRSTIIPAQVAKNTSSLNSAPTVVDVVVDARRTEFPKLELPPDYSFSRDVLVTTAVSSGGLAASQ